VARQTFEAWIWEEFSPDVIQLIKQMSAVEAHGSPVNMRTQTRSTPRSGGVNAGLVSKGGAYNEDTSSNDDVILSAQKFGTAIRIAEEDMEDSLANIIDVKASDWATSYAKTFDNACLAVTAAKATSGCKFDSLYYLLSQNNATTGYTANANITKTGTGGTTYDTLSLASRNVETGGYWDGSSALWIVHPGYKYKLRGIKDSQNRPIFNESSNGTAGGAQHVPDTINGYPVFWSLGARTSPGVTGAPGGNPLAVLCIPQFMLVGRRSGPESFFIDPRTGLAALTDEAILKVRARRAFAPGIEHAFAIHEDTTGL
jgi:HK97 family phage major capsid protein